MERIQRQRAAYVASFLKVDEELRAGQRDAALTRALGETTPTLDALLDEVHQLQQYRKAGAADRTAEVQATIRQTLLVTLALGLGAVVLGALSAVALGRSITQPLAEAVAACRRVAAGHLAPAGRRRVRGDELGQLLQAVDEMTEHLATVVREVRCHSESVATASGEIAQGNHDLSQRTEQQASALQQTAASMEELDATVQTNAHSAEAARALATQTAQVAQQGGDSVQRVADVMRTIEDNARRMAEIIVTIDGIAFQTNILALNAAVEAARAGEQGRGFSVVASEVRALANRAASAAREVKTLVTASTEHTEQGGALAEAARHTMVEVVQSIQRVSDLVRDITAASREQSVGVHQMGEAVTQLDTVTQQNAALAEQGTAAAESLRQQAGQLVAAVSAFTLEGPQPTAA